MTSYEHTHDTDADEADLAEQRSPVDGVEEDEEPTVSPRDDADEGDLLEQSTSVPGDDEDHRE